MWVASLIQGFSITSLPGKGITLLFYVGNLLDYMSSQYMNTQAMCQ